MKRINRFNRSLVFAIAAMCVAFSASAQVAYMDVLQKYSPYYYKNFTIRSSQMLKDTSVQKIYRFTASNGLQIDVVLSSCWGCAGYGNSPYGGICMTCSGNGYAATVSAMHPKNGAMFNESGMPVNGGSGTALSVGGDDDGSRHVHKAPQSKLKRCRQCSGTGDCPSCHKSGTVMYNGHVQQCPRCFGSGRCDLCKGSAFIR